MEYFALILNRSFLVFITDVGLQGWKFSGPVTARVPSFYEPIEELLDAPDMTPGSDAFNDLMHEGTFVIPYSEVSCVSFVAKKKWGMGPIPHTGILPIELTGGRKREFILLGSAFGDRIRDSILARLAAPRPY
jgi:hypothetical protein